MSEFNTAYKQLNKEQKEAVDQIEGPLLVIAGPGTGKTQLLSLRVANILKKTDTDPSSILCLTFTNFAATNMRDRLNSLIGQDSLNVNVQTFHSFAADIMAMYPNYFWNGAPLTIAPDTVQLNTLQAILNNLPPTNLLASKFNGKFTAFYDIREALKLSKEAGLSPEKLQTMIQVNNDYIDLIEPDIIEILSPPLSNKKLDFLQDKINSLPDQQIDASISPLLSLGSVIKESLEVAIVADQESGKTTETGKWKKRWLQSVDGAKGMFDERRRNEWWMEFIEVYKAYRNLLHTAGYYDYADMIVEVITQLELNPDLRAMVQERYLYILIDEFQDTNSAQLRLAHLIASHNTDEQAPNLMAVGDDDQTIFAFNGAELNNMMFFKRNYPSTKQVILKQNYRSHQTILDTSVNIINNAQDRLVNRDQEIAKDLVAASKTQAGTIKHSLYPTREQQFFETAKHIKDLWENESDRTIAVLARNHESLIKLSSLLNQQDVPIRYEQQNNVLDSEIVEQVCLIAEAIQAINDGELEVVNEKLAIMLRHPMWDIDPITLWQIAIENYREPNWLLSLLNINDQPLNMLANWLMDLSKQSIYQPLQIIMEDIMGLDADSEPVSPIRSYFLVDNEVSNDYLNALSACNTLLGLTKELAGMSTKARLKDFVSFVRLNRDLDRPIVDQSWFVSGENAVQLMTVHKAKGLEFDTVFLVDAIEDNWKPRRNSRRSPANLPLQSYGEVYDDYVRLMYVAATRAKRSLIISSFRFDAQGKELLATPLLSAAIQSDVIPDSELPDDIEVLESHLIWPRLKNAEEKSLLKARLENFQLSATGLYQFLDVAYGGPHAFLERNLLRIPEAISTNMAYGTAMHNAMQAAQYLISKSEFNTSAVMKAYQNSLSSQPIRQTDYDGYLQKGRQVLEKVFSDYKFTLPKDGLAEVPMNRVMIGDAQIGGTIDHFSEDENTITITDYKTGRPLSSFTTRDQTKMPKAWRHLLQLDFYALLTVKSHKDGAKKKITTRIAYLESETEKGLLLSHEPTKEGLERLEKLIEIVWAKIMNLDFPDTSKYSKDMQGIESFSQDLLDGKI